MKTTIAMISLSSILACLTLVAQETPRPAAGGGLAERFKQLDRNGDGKLTRDEIPRLFDQIDKNKDGVVTPEEARAYRAGAPVSPAPRPSKPAPSADGLKRTSDIRYANTPGVEAKAQSLDVYAPKDAKHAPVIVFIHGGGWRKGDKSSPYVGSIPAAHFNKHGFVFVSINYRLTPAGKHPANIQDVAKAVAWVHDHIAEHGGDPAQISIMGHSAGAHLTALIATDESRLKAEGKPLSILKRAILLDTAAYDIPRYLKEFQEAGAGGPMRQLYTNAFGDTEAPWRDASPQAHVAPGKNIPPMLLFFTGSRMAANALAPALAAALTQAGSPSRAVDTITLKHNEIGQKSADETHPLGQLVLKFLQGTDVTTFPAKLDGKTPAAPAKPAPAATNNPQVEALFQRLDRNRDGRLSAEEFKVWRTPRMPFERLDGDKDGFVTKEEALRATSGTPNSPTPAKPSASAAESVNENTSPLAFAEANGVLYAAVGVDPKSKDTHDGGLFLRVDGPQPRWEWLYRWEVPDTARAKPAMRGLTAIPAADGKGQELIGALETMGRIEVINPAQNHAARREFDIRAHFEKA